jgi:hypothetical protein
MLESVVIEERNGVHSPTAAWNAISMTGGGNGLERRIREKLAAAEEARRLLQEQRRQAVRELNDRLKCYTASADRLMEEVIRPCMRQLAGCFPEADRPDELQSRHGSVCHFPHTARFPAVATLELGVTRDGDARTVMVQYDLQILPIFSPIHGHDRLDMPLDEIDQRRVAQWVEAQILTFVESYLRLEAGEPDRTDDAAAACGGLIGETGARRPVRAHCLAGSE